MTRNAARFSRAPFNGDAQFKQKLLIPERSGSGRRDHSESAATDRERRHLDQRTADPAHTPARLGYVRAGAGAAMDLSKHIPLIHLNARRTSSARDALIRLISHRLSRSAEPEAHL